MYSFLRAATADRLTISFLGSWLLGLLAGTLFAAYADDSLYSLMRTAAYGRVSIVLLLSAAILPFLITAYAVSNYRYSIVFLLALVKGFSYSFCGILIAFAFGSAGWLVRPMLQFTQNVTTPLFCWFAVHSLGSGRPNGMERGICIAICILAVIIDFLLVSPFLASLM